MDQPQNNPLRQGTRLEATAEPCVVVIFGASGDLTSRKLVPALYRLTQERLIPAEFGIVGFSRSAMSHDAFREKMKEAVATFSEAKRVDEEVWKSFAGESSTLAATSMIRMPIAG
jgi:glucose-6-phosphate 1-dehydrogenase